MDISLLAYLLELNGFNSFKLFIQFKLYYYH